MGRYLIRRVLFMILVLFVVSLITFIIFVKLPASDPARRAVGRQTTPENVEAARHAFGLDKPLYVQYGRFAKGLIPWPGLFLNEDVYYSYTNFVPVKEEIFSRLPVTITLAVGAAITWVLIGIPIGIISAVKRGSVWDRGVHGVRAHRRVGAGVLARLPVPVHLLVQVGLGPTVGDPDRRIGDRGGASRACSSSRGSCCR